MSLLSIIDEALKFIERQLFIQKTVKSPKPKKE